MEKHTLTLALSDSSRGYEISPDRVPAAVLAEFAKDVSDFIKGSGKSDMGSIDVSVRHGSLAMVASGLPMAPVFRDLCLIENNYDISRIDSKRKAIIEKWQERARKLEGVAVKIAASALTKEIVINKTSQFRDFGTARFVNVERYIQGEIQDLGGVSKPNAHVILPDGTKLIVKTDRRLVQQESVNRVYQEAHMRIRGKLNLDTNELTDVELISFVEYAPKFDKKDMENLVAKGRQAWADVEDPVEWVRSIRGEH